MTKSETLIKSLVNAAKHERWDLVDSSIAVIAHSPEYYKWAYSEGLKDPDGNVRDLAISIIERSDIPEHEFDLMRESLCGLMLKDSNRYVRFRAAFALANHGPKRYEGEVIRKLEEALGDKDIRGIAQDYLGRMRTTSKC